MCEVEIKGEKKKYIKIKHANSSEPKHFGNMLLLKTDNNDESFRFPEESCSCCLSGKLILTAANLNDDGSVQKKKNK